MVLLWGLMEDGPLAAVARCLDRLEARTMFIDQRRVLEYAIELEVGGVGDALRGSITGPDGSFELDRARSIYLRQYNFEQLDVFAEIDRHSDSWRQAAQFEDSLLLWCEMTNAKVVNRPSAMGSNSSKPYQLEIIRQHGFLVPETLITTDPDIVVAFWQKHRHVIYKSISSSRSIVAQLTEADLGRIDEVAYCPTQFQRFIAGTDYRVHVLGERVFAHRITCPDDDYRYSKHTQIDNVELGSEIETKCLTLTGQLGLLFSGIDLRLSEWGEWYCFEVNASPGYSYFEDEAKSISSELALCLSSDP